jgi:hypothetical protein
MKFIRAKILEFIIFWKVEADGFIAAPNEYLQAQGHSNQLDIL